MQGHSSEDRIYAPGIFPSPIHGQKDKSNIFTVCRLLVNQTGNVYISRHTHKASRDTSSITIPRNSFSISYFAAKSFRFNNRNLKKISQGE